MNEKLISVMIRAQCKCMEEQKNNLGGGSSTIVWPDQPNMVELLQKPNNITELVPASSKTFQKVSKHITEHLGSFYFVPLHSTLYLNHNSRSVLARDEMLRDLVKICRKINIYELVILKNENNLDLIKLLTTEIKNNSNWTGPRICTIQGVKKVMDTETKKIILNDFHLLPTRGNACVNRMYNNIKKYYFWSGMYNDVRKLVKKCDSCQKQKYSNHHTKQTMVITSTANCAFQKVYLYI